jgi:hypothetical protein
MPGYEEFKFGNELSRLKDLAIKNKQNLYLYSKHMKPEIFEKKIE